MRIVDLTHPMSDDMPMLAGMARPSFRDIALMERDGYRMSEYQLLNHSGTHVDAPSHLAADGETLDEIDLTRLVCDAVTIDVSAREPGLLPLAELEPQLGDVRAGDLVFLHSGNAARYGTEAYWTGWSYPDADATRALVELGISGIGFDGPSADPVDTAGLRAAPDLARGRAADPREPRQPRPAAAAGAGGRRAAEGERGERRPGAGARAAPRMKVGELRRGVLTAADAMGAHPRGAVARARRRVRHLGRGGDHRHHGPARVPDRGRRLPVPRVGGRALREPDGQRRRRSTRTSRPASGRARASSGAGSTAAASRSGSRSCWSSRASSCRPR